MRLAIEAVEEGRAGAVVSSGNTGALMALSRLVLKPLDGIHRPALASVFPAINGQTVMLDLGANVLVDAESLVQFAVMGSVFARLLKNVSTPSVGLLNVGSEDMKGPDHVRAAAAVLLQIEFPGEYKGFVEGNDITLGTVDVVVCDGFTGNIALKSIEGTARFVTDLLRRAFTSSIRSKFGFLVSRPATELLRHHLDPNNHNGAVFLGLNGVVVKSHGGANSKGVAHAVEVAARLVEEDITARITQDLARIQPK
jgi:glycerol-3-phosphate acyltransferase PlsX